MAWVKIEPPKTMTWSSGRSMATTVLSTCLEHPLARDQFILPTRDEAVSQALAFAKRQCVRAWFANGDDEFLFLGTFRKEEKSR